MRRAQLNLWILSGCIAIVIAAASTSYSQQEELKIPPRQNYVSDYALIIEQPAESELNRLLDQVKREMGVEIYILTISTANPLSINEYGQRISEAWNLGEQDANRKTFLFLVAKDEGRYRLMTNKGLETIVTDEQLQKISDNVIKPPFEGKEYSKGIVAGINQVLQVLAQETGSPVPAKNGSQGFFPSDLLGILAIVALLTLLVVGAALLF